MKRILFGSALLAALTLPALAGTEMAPSSGKDMKDVKQVAQVQQSDAGFYVAAFGGANFDTWFGNNRQTITSGGGTTIETHSPIDSGWGGVGGIKAGYNFESFEFLGMSGLRLQPAVEAEGMYIGDNADSDFAGGHGTLSSNSADFFLNGILRFKNNSIVTPYIGIGAGLQYITTHEDFQAPGAHYTGLNTSDTDFAAQALIGFDVQVCRHISIFSEYKFVDAIGNDGKSNNFPGGTYRFKPDQIEQNLITAGVKYTF